MNQLFIQSCETTLYSALIQRSRPNMADHDLRTSSDLLAGLGILVAFSSWQRRFS
jgi:hypothetical protein